MVSSKSLPVAQAVAAVAPYTGPWVVISAYLQLQPPLDAATSCVKLEVRSVIQSDACD
jgi:hypothetical protein